MRDTKESTGVKAIAVPAMSVIRHV